MKKNDSTPNDPITKKHEVQQSNDEHIDQDFEGFPHSPANEELITPKTKEEKQTAKVVKPSHDTDELQSDGSGGAFEATENMEFADDDDFTRIDDK
jgi:hypothetical protein